MAILRFASEEAKRACCDAAHMRRAHGPEVARRISRRLQQLEAMESLSDLQFLPFNSLIREDGVVEVSITDQLMLLIQRDASAPERDQLMYQITINGLEARSPAAKSS